MISERLSCIFGIKYKWSAVQWYDRQQCMVIIYANDE